MATQRRLDRILRDDYLDGVGDAPAEQLRTMRDECARVESDLSYARRVLQGRIDIVRGELAQRGESGSERAASLLDRLPDILGANGRASGTPGSRFTDVDVPPAARFGRRELDAVIDEEPLGDLQARSLDELEAVVERLLARERELSDLRQALFDRLDRIQEQLADRYKAGTASIGDVLRPSS